MELVPTQDEVLALLRDPFSSGGVAGLNADVEKPFVRFARGKRARSAQSQSLVDGVLQPTVRRLDIAVLMRIAREVA